MSKKPDSQHMKEYLKDMLKDKPKDEPVEKTLAIFCERYGVNMEECQVHYDELVKKGVIKE
jgi:hypothetical protein